MATGNVRAEVMNGLQLLTVEQLEEGCTSLGLPVAQKKKSKFDAVLNVVLRHLTSEDLEELEDEGQSVSVLLALNDQIKTTITKDDDEEPSSNRGRSKVLEPTVDKTVNNKEARF